MQQQPGPAGNSVASISDTSESHKVVQGPGVIAPLHSLGLQMIASVHLAVYIWSLHLK